MQKKWLQRKWLDRKWYIMLAGMLIMLAGYIWESNQYKEKTYANVKGGRLWGEGASVLGNGATQTSLEENPYLYSGLIIENERVKTVKKEKDEEKVAYLTFDDGPSEVTELVLDTLKEYEVKATFFVVGNEIRGDREAYLRRMVQEGHAIGIHTYTHEQKEIYQTAEAYVEDVIKTSEKVSEVCGFRSNIYRFPWGSANCYIKGICEQITDKLDSMNMVYHDWNVSAEDSVGRPTAYSIKRNIQKDFKRYNQPVILLHDSMINELTAKVLPDIIDMIRKEGYRFDTLPNRKKPYQYLNR